MDLDPFSDDNGTGGNEYSMHIESGGDYLLGPSKGSLQRLWWWTLLRWSLFVYVFTLLFVATFFIRSASIHLFVFVHHSFPYLVGMITAVITFRTRLIELKRDPDHPRIKRIWRFAYVALTVGYVGYVTIAFYGYRVPVTTVSKLVTGIWGFIVSATSFGLSLREPSQMERSSSTGTTVGRSVSSIEEADQTQYSCFDLVVGEGGYALMWSTVVYQASWFVLFFFLFWTTDEVVNAIQQRKAAWFPFVIFHVSALLWKLLLGYIGRKIGKGGKSVWDGVEDGKDEDESKKHGDKKRGKFSINADIGRKQSSKYEINQNVGVVGRYDDIEGYKTTWWEIYSVFGVALLWSMMNRTLFLSVFSYRDFIINGIITMVFDLLVSCGRLFRGWINCENRVARACPLLLGWLAPTGVATEQGMKQEQRNRYAYYITGHIANVCTLLLALPIFWMTAKYAPDRFPTASGKLSGLSLTGMMAAVIILGVLEFVGFALAELLFCAWVPHLSLQVPSVITRAVTGHGLNFIMASLFITVTVVSNLTDIDYLYK